MPKGSLSTRLRRTQSLVRAEDQAARVVITLGGIGVVVAVLGICVYLVITVLPLFEGGAAHPALVPVEVGVSDAEALIVDEDVVAATILTADGSLRTVLIADGAIVREQSLLEGSVGGAGTLLFTPPNADGTIIGVEADGAAWFGTLSFSAALLPAELGALSLGVVGASLEGGSPVLDATTPRGGFLHRTAAGQVRLSVPTFARAASILLQDAPANPERVAGAQARSGERFLAILRSDGEGAARGAFGSARTVTPLGEAPREEWTSLPLVVSRGDAPGLPAWLFVTSDGAAVLAVYRDGLCIRLARAAGRVVEVERRRLVAEGRAVTAATMLLGGQTLVVGDDAGFVHGWFTARDPDAGTPDSMRLVEAHKFPVSDSAVIALAAASRDRLVLAADSQGHATLVHMTSHKRVARADSRVGPLAAIALSPRGDAVLLAGENGLLDPWSVSLGHPKASWHALFGTPLYEGQTEGSYVYQSSAGSDQAELKMSLVPLLFGTLKATLFATLFAIPLAVFAAVYTSEFMSPRTRRVVKPVIELMASLPSVVLGFVASMVVAPLLASWLPSVLACLIAVPVAVLLGAHLWQMASARWLSRIRGGRQLALVGAWAALGIALGIGATPVLESVLFSPSRADTLVRAGSTQEVPADEWPRWIGDRRSLSPAESRELRAQGLAFRAGRVVRPVEPAADRADAIREIIERNDLDQPDLRAWLDGTIGTGLPGWIVVLFIPSMIAAWLGVHAVTRVRFGRIQRPGALALADIVRFVGILGLSVVLDLGASLGLSVLGQDPRDSILGPFSVRNSLVVGIIMGFAIIPIIYTISEDAMRGVPQGLRLASLGSGATPWQTAVRVVLPVAASGIFSACMIGLGRAVGETMIVLMATGNSPEMNWNIFSGFRTLAANIAVELPESDKGSTHYRLLFLCGLLLFGLTFLINTTAEVLRQYFRRKNANL